MPRVLRLLHLLFYILHFTFQKKVKKLFAQCTNHDTMNIVIRIIIFATVLIVTYALLLSITHFSSSVQYGFSNFTRNMAATLVPSKDVEWVDNFANRGNGADINVKVITPAKNPKTGQIQRFQGVGKLTSRTKVVVPFTVLFSFILASLAALPMSWRNRFIVFALAALMFFLYMFFMFKMTVSYVEKVTQGANIEEITFGQIFNTNIGFMTIIPIIIWLLSTVWAVDWKKLLPENT